MDYDIKPIKNSSVPDWITGKCGEGGWILMQGIVHISQVFFCIECNVLLCSVDDVCTTYNPECTFQLNGNKINTFKKSCWYVIGQ